MTETRRGRGRPATPEEAAIATGLRSARTRALRKLADIEEAMRAFARGCDDVRETELAELLGIDRVGTLRRWKQQ